MTISFDGPDLAHQPQKASDRSLQRKPVSLPFISNMPSVVQLGIYGIVYVALFLSWEKLAPPTFKPSFIVGSWEEAINEATIRGQMKAKAEFEAYFKEVELRAMQMQELYKTTLSMVARNYDATYQRSQILLQATAQMQTQLMEQRIALSARLSGGDTAVATFSSLASAISRAMGENEIADVADEVNRAAKAKALQDMNDAARSAGIVAIPEWPTAIFEPSEVMKAFDSLPPIHFPTPEEFKKQRKANDAVQ